MTQKYSEIRILGDASSIQKDRGRLETWSQTSGLALNEAKCKAQRVTKKKPKSTMSTYKLNNSLLGTCTAGKDLCVWIINGLTWNKQVYEQSVRANKLLGYIKRNTRFILGTAVRRTLFLGLVRPHLGYATQIWAPQSIELTAKLERIQRGASRFILSLPYSSTTSYKL